MVSWSSRAKASRQQTTTFLRVSRETCRGDCFGYHISMQQRHQKGFTLVELLVVITIIGTLASIVVVAVNPRGQFLAAKDAGRRQDATQLANALSQYMIDHG